MKFKLIILALIVIIFSNAVSAAPFTADAKTRRIPAGTKLRLQLMEPITSIGGQAGDFFSAMLLDDQKIQTCVILPAGSVIRGNVSKILPARMLSRGATIYLDFDHVVTPTGRQIPLTMSVCNRADLTLDGGIFGSKGYGEAVQNNWKRTVEITQNATRYGSDLGEDAFAGAKYITTPLCAVGGAFGGGAYFVGDSVADLFRKGKDVYINQGTILEVMIINPIDIPVN